MSHETPPLISSLVGTFDPPEQMSVAQWKAIFEFIGFGMVLVDVDGSAVETNKKFQDMVGYSGEELMGMSWKQITHPDDFESEESAKKRMLAGEKFTSNEKRYIKKDGSPIWVSLNGTMLKDEKGTPTFLIVAVRDITLRKAAEERFRRIFEGVGVGMLMITITGDVIMSNRFFQDMLGYDEAEIKGVNWRKVTHPDDISAEEKRYEKLLAKEVNFLQREKRYLRKDGAYLWARVMSTLLSEGSGEQQYIAVAAQDISSEKKFKQQLVDYQKQLHALAVELSLAEERERKRVAADIHDRITQGLSMAKMELEDLSESYQHSRLSQDIKRILSFMEETLDESRSMIFSLYPPVLSELGFEAALEWLAERFNYQYEIEVDFVNDDLPKPLDLDVQGVLFRSIGELVLNVLKHSGSQRATLNLTRKNQNLFVLVEDHGIGFDVNEITKRPTHQGHFGLFSIKERIELLGGQFEIDAIAGKGTKASIIMPLEDDGTG